MKRVLLVCGVAMLLVCGCKKAQEPEAQPAPDAKAPAAAQQGEAAQKPADAKDQPAQTGMMELGRDFFNETCTLADRGPGIDYVLNEDLYISCALTIEPGVEIASKAQGVEIVIQDGGSLKAIGTAEKPIIIGAGGDAPMGRIMFNESANKGATQTFSYVTFKNMGGNKDEALTIHEGVSIAMDHVTIDGSQTNGIWTRGIIKKFENNTIKNCKGVPLTIEKLASLSQLGADNVYSDNGNNVIALKYDYDNDFGSGLTFSKQSIPWFISDDILFSNSDKSMSYTIPAGSQFKLAGGVRIEFANRAKVAMNGTAEAPIVFEAADPESPWANIKLYDNASLKAAYVTIKNADGRGWGGAVTVADTCTAEFDHLTIDGVNSDDDGNGLNVERGGRVTKLENSAISHCKHYPIKMNAIDSVAFGAGNAFADNGENMIYVEDPRLAHDTVKELTIGAQPVPYYIASGLGIGQAEDRNMDVTIAAGAKFVMGRNVVLDFEDEVALNIAGTPEAPVVMTSEDDMTWNGLRVGTMRQSALHNLTIDKVGNDFALGIRHDEKKQAVTLDRVSLSSEGACIQAETKSDIVYAPQAYENVKAVTFAKCGKETEFGDEG